MRTLFVFFSLALAACSVDEDLSGINLRDSSLGETEYPRQRHQAIDGEIIEDSDNGTDAELEDVQLEPDTPEPDSSEEDVEMVDSFEPDIIQEDIFIEEDMWPECVSSHDASSQDTAVELTHSIPEDWDFEDDGFFSVSWDSFVVCSGTTTWFHFTSDLSQPLALRLVLENESVEEGDVVEKWFDPEIGPGIGIGVRDTQFSIFTDDFGEVYFFVTAGPHQDLRFSISL